MKKRENKRLSKKHTHTLKPGIDSCNCHLFCILTVIDHHVFRSQKRVSKISFFRVGRFSLLFLVRLLYSLRWPFFAYFTSHRCAYRIGEFGISKVPCFWEGHLSDFDETYIIRKLTSNATCSYYIEPSGSTFRHLKPKNKVKKSVFFILLQE